MERRATLREAILGACAEDGRPVDDDVLAGAAAFLGDLAERGVLLGAAA